MELETVYSENWGGESLCAEGEVSGAGGQLKLTLSSIIIFRFFELFWRQRRWHENYDSSTQMES